MLTAAVWCGAALALLGHALLWTGIVNRLHGLKGPRSVIKLLTAVCVGVFAALPLLAARWWWLHRTADVNLFQAGGWLEPYACGCAVLGALGLIVKPWIERLRYDRRTLVRWTAEPLDIGESLGERPLHGAYARLLGSLPGNDVLALSVDRKRLVLPRLPAELAGLTVAHISDLHMTGGVGAGFYDAVARAVNDLRPDVIALTGDIVENEACWPWLEKFAGALCAPLGVHFVLGNHDLFIDADRTRTLLIDAGLTCLSRRWVRAAVERRFGAIRRQRAALGPARGEPRPVAAARPGGQRIPTRAMPFA